MNEELNMSVSPICVKDGKKYAYIMFSDNVRVAEGIIPDCRIINNNGFLEDEVRQLEAYMERCLPELKRLAAGQNAFNAMRKEQ
ncbi:MAG: hypothetical protein K2K56_02050 [Lachnospiraceae bacterium]|nr:hypothetical protein [Lachnospiraceae bacterium]MDE6625134.1 hypothetical protein [Lachnospiraceae bacterium]